MPWFVEPRPCVLDVASPHAFGESVAALGEHRAPFV